MDTLDLLLNNDLPEPKEKRYKVPRLSKAFGSDFILTLREVSFSRVASINKMHGDDGEMDLHILLAGIVSPDFKDKRLLDKLGAATPLEAVKKVFSAGEIGRISHNIQTLSGYMSNVLEELEKN